MTRKTAFVPPMLARLVTGPPAGPGWVYERKLDGLRCIAVRAGEQAELWSRSRQSFTARFGGIVRALAELSAGERDTSPFVDLKRMKDAHWAEPQLVANIAFTEWTADGKLRHPRFEGLRSDKDPRAVIRESPT